MSLNFKDIVGHLPDSDPTISRVTLRRVQENTFNVVCNRYSASFKEEVSKELKQDSKFRAECVRDLEDEVFQKLKKNPEIISKLRSELRQELEEKERKVLVNKLKKEVKQEITPDIRKEVKDDFMKKLAREHPNVQERSNFVALLHDLEVECLAVGETAMRTADNLEGWIGLRKLYNFIVMFFAPITMLSIIGMVAWKISPMMTTDNWIIYAASSFIMFFLSMFAFNQIMFNLSNFQSKIDAMRENASTYANLADDIKRHRLMTVVSAESKSELSKAIDDIYERKRLLDSLVHPDPDKLSENKVRIKSNMLNDYDPMKTLRVEEIKDFDSRLAEAEAAYEQEAKKKEQVNASA